METRVFESKFNVFRASKLLTKEQMKGCKGGDYGDGDYGNDDDRGCFDCICKDDPDTVIKRAYKSDCASINACGSEDNVESSDPCPSEGY